MKSESDEFELEIFKKKVIKIATRFQKRGHGETLSKFLNELGLLPTTVTAKVYGDDLDAIKDFLVEKGIEFVGYKGQLMNSSTNYDILKALSEKEISIEEATANLGISATSPTDHYLPGTVLAGDDSALIYIFIKHYAGSFANKWVAHNWYYGVIEKGLVYGSYEQLQQAFPGCGFKVIHGGWLSSLLAP